MEFLTPPWWKTDDYNDDSPCGPLNLNDESLWGPNGAAMVQLWNNGTTNTGWGRDTFMKEYKRNAFNPKRILHGYEKGAWNFAWIMRSANLVCIDIDGKNGGLDHATELGFLPPTAAETSKSGNGYHLFYHTDDSWDAADGFAEYRDHIGIVTGVDIRGTGCVYHYPTQRWNGRDLAILPPHLKLKLQAKRLQQQAASNTIKKTLELEPEEIAMMHDQMIEDLAKPIPAGKRNNTLFAIGSKMKEAEVPKWEELIEQRAYDVGLEDDEIDKLIRNITNYS